MAKYTKWIDASPDEMISEVAVRSLRSRIEPVRDYLVLAAEESGKDLEYVHQVRVWSRRAVAAINIYRNLLPKRRRRWMKDQLNGIRRASNDARDDDVFAERLAADKDNPGAARLLKKVQSHRQQSQEPIAEVYGQLVETGIFERRAEKLLERVRLRGVGNPKDKFCEWAVERIRPQLRKFFAAGEDDLTSATALHQFRIRGKKLRYAVELLAGAFTDEIREVGHPLIRNLQDRLGEINDHATARVRLKSWMDHSDDKEEAAYLQEMLDDEQRQLDDQRGEFLSWWNGKREKDLRKAFASVISGK
ncbi:MAG: CHAD domain-containing protein [Planctomycetes bacterium]|nr:CHAD domain-containing protein [Planctomycetota bacterium]MBL7039769.1 CHAD domain-containing protein [Pirellulaceae bacterium]